MRPMVRVDSGGTGGSFPRPPEGPLQNLLVYFGWGMLVCLWGVTLFHFQALPESIPVHFDEQGLPDETGKRVTLLILPITGTLVFGLLAVLSRFPRKWNFPVTVDPENARELYARTATLLHLLNLVIPASFTWIVWRTVLNIRGEVQGLGTFFLPVFLSAIGIPVIWFVYRTIRLQ